MEYFPAPLEALVEQFGRLPGIGGLLNVNHSFGAEYESGVYQGERFQMVVSRGLGNSIPVPRFLNRPELVKMILHCGQS